MNDFILVNGSHDKFDKIFYLEGLSDLLKSGDLTSHVVDIKDLSVSNLCEANAFIFYNTDYNDRIRRFIESGKRFNRSFYLLKEKGLPDKYKFPKEMINGTIFFSQDKEIDEKLTIPYVVSEHLLGRLKHTRHYLDRQAIYLDIDEEVYNNIIGLINEFLSQPGDRRLYSLRELDENLLTENNRSKLIYLDRFDPNLMIRAVNKTMVAIVGASESREAKYIERLLMINKTPVINQKNSKLIDSLGSIVSSRKYVSDSIIYKKAYEIVHRYGSVYNSHKLVKDIQATMNTSVGINIPGGKVSGGILVAIKHAQILQKKGYSVTLISDDKYDHKRLFEIGKDLIPGVSRKVRFISANFDKLIATLWVTYYFVAKYRKAREKFYLVQGFETDFTEYGHGYRTKANRTYFDDKIKYRTISLWIKEWLTEKYGRKDVKYAPNGLDLELFRYRERELERKFKILIEGNPLEPFRGIEEAFKIVNELDRDKYEIHFLSNRKIREAEMKDWLKPDKSYYEIPYDKVSEVYSGCDLLLKCSILESFSYPPLEMMATGGVCVIAENDGNKVYAKNGVNCLTYRSGDVDTAREHIKKIGNDKELFKSMVTEGLETVKKYSWEKIEDRIFKLYE